MRGAVPLVVRVAPQQRERRKRKHVEWERVVAVIEEAEFHRVHDAYTVRATSGQRDVPAVALSVGRSTTEYCGEKEGREKLKAEK